MFGLEAFNENGSPWGAEIGAALGVSCHFFSRSFLSSGPRVWELSKVLGCWQLCCSMQADCRSLASLVIASGLVIICVAKWVKSFNFFPAGPGRRGAVCSSPPISYALFSPNVDLTKQAPVFCHCIFLANFKRHFIR